MRKKIALSTFLLYTLFLGAQISFDPGYFIDNKTKKQECLIENKDWKNNPTSFRYKTSEEGNIQEIHIRDLQEFGINGASRYIVYRGGVSWSSTNPSTTSSNNEITLEQDTVALKVLVEGKATLYYLEKRTMKHFFFRVDNNPVKPLLYKIYDIGDHMLRTNNQYKEQLNTALSLSENEIGIERIGRLTYDKKSLVDLFIDYNKLNDTESKLYTPQKKGKDFHINFRPGLQRSAISITNTSSFSTLLDVYWEENTTLRLGFEAEYVLPFYRNKLSFSLEPTYQSYKSSTRDIFQSENKIDYHSIELGAGFRYYTYFGKRSKVFVNGIGIFDFPIESQSEVKLPNLKPLVFGFSSTVAFGAGYCFANKLSVEIRQRLNKNIFRPYEVQSEYKALSLIFGYTIY
jgi:hypothetical protein